MMFLYSDIQWRIDFEMKDLIILGLNLQKMDNIMDQLPCFAGILEMIVAISRGPKPHTSRNKLDCDRLK